MSPKSPSSRTSQPPGATEAVIFFSAGSGVREMVKDETTVHEVIGRRLQFLACDVMLTHLDIAGEIAHAIDVDVSGQHRSCRAHPGPKPASDRTCTGPDLQTAPSRADSDGVEMTDRGRITGLLQISQPDAFDVRVGRIRARSSHHRPFAPRDRPMVGEKPVRCGSGVELGWGRTVGAALTPLAWFRICSEEIYASAAAEMGDDENGNRLCGAARKRL